VSKLLHLSIKNLRDFGDHLLLCAQFPFSSRAIIFIPSLSSLAFQSFLFSQATILNERLNLEVLHFKAEIYFLKSS
jgi:hypothetical protein